MTGKTRRALMIVACAWFAAQANEATAQDAVPDPADESADTASNHGHSPAELADIVQKDPNGLLLIDIRSFEEYLSGTLPMAIHVDETAADEFKVPEATLRAILATRDGSNEKQIQRWLDRLRGQGITAGFLAGGIDAWRASGLPMAPPEPHYSRPGEHEFRVPKGICEGREPAQVYEGSGRSTPR